MAKSPVFQMGQYEKKGYFSVHADERFNDHGFKHVHVAIFCGGLDRDMGISWQADREGWAKSGPHYYAGRVTVESSAPDQFTMAAGIVRKLDTNWQNDPLVAVQSLVRMGFRRIVNVKNEAGRYESEWADAEPLRDLTWEHYGVWSVDIPQGVDGLYCREYYIGLEYNHERALLKSLGERINETPILEAIKAGTYTIRKWQPSFQELKLPVLMGLETAE